MELKSLTREWRVWVLGLSLLVSLFFLGPHYVQGDEGGYAMETSLNKGLELKGGTRVLLDVKANNTTEQKVEEVKRTLQTRISAFGLTQTDIRTVRLGEEYKIQIEVADTNRSRLENLLSQEGSFQARMPLHVDGSREFELEKTYNFEKTDSGIRVNGTRYEPGDSFELGGTRFLYHNDSGSTARLEVVAYSGEDVEQVVRTDAVVEGSGFRFPVIISREAAINVRNVARNYDTVTVQTANGPTPYLGMEDGSTAQLRMYVDGNRESALNVAASFKNNVITQPTISGGGEDPASARNEMQRLQSILESGRLPYPVQIETISTITSSLGGEFLSAAFLSVVMSLVAVGGLVFLRYGDVKVAVPIVITGSSEVFILLGAWFSTIATLDLASIAGIVAAVGTGVDDQIIITDESGRKRVRSWKKRMKRAFFVIFTSAASTIGAMMPIVTPELSTLGVIAAGLGMIGYTLYGSRNPHYLAIGGLAVAVGVVAQTLSPSAFALQAVKGFAVTTILGIMVGIAITRPAYATILEHLKE